MIAPPKWDTARLEEDRQQAIAIFRKERLQEPLDVYAAAVDEQSAVVEKLLKLTSDLTELNDETVSSILCDSKYSDAFRYLAGPPISADAWRTLADVATRSKSRMKADPEVAKRLVSIVLAAIDRRRFPWLAEDREPTEIERSAAVLASACLWACQRAQTGRRSSAKRRLEDATRDCLVAGGFAKASTRTIHLLSDAPKRGEYCGETSVAGRRSDLVAGLWDGRHALMECKDSNSLVNSIKRLNNDTAAKAAYWNRIFGERSVVPVAIISGVFYLDSLVRAQETGLTLFWGHRLNELTVWLDAVRSSASE